MSGSVDGDGGVTVADMHGPMVTGGIPSSVAVRVWVVLLLSDRMGESGVVYAVFDADPGADYPDRLADALRVTRHPLAGNSVEVVEQVVTGCPR